MLLTKMVPARLLSPKLALQRRLMKKAGSREVSDIKARV